MAKIRAQKAGGAAPAAPAPTPEPVAEAPAAPAAAEAAPVAAAAKPAPAAPAGKPGSTADILAKIRAQKAGGTVPAADAPATPAAAAPVVAAATSAPAAVAAKPAAPSGPLPSVADMVRAARQGAVAAPAATAAATAKPPVVAPPMPAKPAPVAAKKGAAPAPARRSLSAIVTVAAVSLTSFVLGALAGSPLLICFGVFVWGLLMTPFAAAWASISAVTGISVLGTARFMFPNVLVEPPSKFKVGPASDYPLNTVSNKWKDQFGIWIVHTDQYEGKNLIYALSTVCTHLGCTPNWLDGEQKYKCPCHGSGFYMTGVNFEGPAPRPLERMGLRIAEDGMLEVDKSV
ncbi:MAG TPA: ubiquinol-cytochrome c reductase iron-sulfur subunit, partial [Planctomycetaceae bacterium]|nr:ubiquinol-cytochrome c reductase iron-sulfur subunit [Planctomycetaceae bacterium]